MRWLLPVLAACLAIGCAAPTVIVIPGMRTAQEARMPERAPLCRYSRVAITHAESKNLSAGDLELNARVSALMGDEWRRRGANVTENAGDAYWSIMVIAAEDSRFYGGFVFSATVSLRQLHEAGDPGLAALEGKETPAGQPTFYTGIAYGPGHELESTVARFVANADAALLPAASSLCKREGYEIMREVEAELAVPSPVPL